MIPLVDLKAQYRSIKTEIDEAIRTVINETAFYKGRHVEEFERKFALMFGSKCCVGVANCTDALYIVLKCLGCTSGDEVITAANTFIATSEAITATGARVVFCDVDSKTFNIDTAKIRELITPYTKAIVPVHLNGRAVDMTAIGEIAAEFKLKVVEDCAQAPWAEWRGKKVGTIGDVGCFSFYPAKNLGAYGDAGCIITSDEVLAHTIRMVADHGRTEKYEHIFEGMSSRLDGLQAAILNVKLDYLNEWSIERQTNAQLYRKYLEGVEGVKLPEIPGVAEFKTHVFHVFQVIVDSKNRAKIRERMRDYGIETGMHYPIALPNQTAYKYLGHTVADFPVASWLQERNMSLPMYPELTKKQIRYISDCLIEIVNDSAP